MKLQRFASNKSHASNFLELLWGIPFCSSMAIGLSVYLFVVINMKAEPKWEVHSLCDWLCSSLEGLRNHNSLTGFLHSKPLSVTGAAIFSLGVGYALANYHQRKLNCIPMLKRCDWLSSLYKMLMLCLILIVLIILIFNVLFDIISLTESGHHFLISIDRFHVYFRSVAVTYWNLIALSSWLIFAFHGTYCLGAQFILVKTIWKEEKFQP